MPMIKFDRVVSCSSEDPNHSAKSLLATETYKKWKCKNQGEDQISVVLQLEKSSLINSLDIGNEYSAFIEVLVARSTGDAEDFKVLLVASSFMTPMEARNGEHPNRVRMFNRDHLSKPAVDERWDRVKVVCRQPFNRHVQYGLTFLKLHTSQQEQSDEVAPHRANLGRFVIRDESPDRDDIRVGSLFAVKHGASVAGGLLGGPHKPPPTGAAAIIDASKPAALAEQSGSRQSPATKVDKASSASKKADPPAKDSHRQHEGPKEAHRNGILCGHGPSNKPHNGKEVSSEHTPARKRLKQITETEAAAGTSKAKNEVAKAAPVVGRRQAKAVSSGRKKKARAEVSYYKLLNGVTLVISGYQNPLRGNLREAALEMGAKYRPDWGPGCTHLVCAFPNTPKFNQVKGHGKIVCKEWIEDCHSQRKRLPWRRYAMDKKDQIGPESDTEEEEEESESEELNNGELHAAPMTPPSHSEEPSSNKERTVQVKGTQLRPSLFAPLGTDSTKQTRTPASPGSGCGAQQKQPHLAAPSSSAAADEFYDADTDVDDDSELPSYSDLHPLPHLPNLFGGATFCFGPSLSEISVQALKRYITAYGGDIVSSVDCANYLVTNNIKDCEKLKLDCSKCTAVRPAWVWACNDTLRLVPVARFKLE